jgi:glutathione peroxidase
MNLNKISLLSWRMGLINLECFYNQPIVIFTSASLSEFINQLYDFQKLYEEKKIVPIALPTHDFGNQEPGNDLEIYQYYTKKFGVTFPIANKTDMNHSFFKTFGEPNWNFNKYLFDKKHNFLKQFNAYTLPLELLNYV